MGINTSAQETIEITYKNYFVGEGSSLFRLKSSSSKRTSYWNSIISNDTTFTFAGDGKKGKIRHISNGYYPDTILHHSNYYASQSNSVFETSAYKGNYFIAYESKPNPKNYWMDTTKNILKIECQAAMIFSDNGDSSTMWIARSLQPGLITFHHGYVVPGIAMETLDLKHGCIIKR